MLKTAVVVPEGQHFILSSLSPSPAQRRLALAVLLALLAAFLITEGLLSTIQLGRIDAFVPAYATAMFVSDLITSSPSCVRLPCSRSPVDISSLRSSSFRGC